MECLKNNIPCIDCLKGKITCIDCLAGFKAIPDSSIDLIITSPPYNFKIKYDTYDDNKSKDDYFNFIKTVAKCMFNVIKDDGRVCINVPIDGSMYTNETDVKKQKIDIIFEIKSIFYEVGFKYKDQIFWDKEHLSSKTAFGSYESASCPNILLPFEVVLVFYKKSKKKYNKPLIKEFINTDYTIYTNGHWKIKGVTNKIKNKCPVPYPEELVKRLILLYSYSNELILDPFSGNGTTCLVAKKLRRQFIGFEISTNYCDYSNEILENIGSE